MTMAKLTAQQIDARVQRMLAHIERLVDAGEMTPADAEKAMRDLAQWSTAHYAKLPAAQAVDAIMTQLLGSRR